MSDRHPATDADSVSLPSVVPDSFSATSSSAAVCLLDPEQRFVWLNKELAALNGVAASRIFGRTLRDVLGPFAEQIQTHLHVVQAGGEPLLNVEISGFHSIRQAAVHWRLHLFPIRDEQGKLTRFGMIVNELTGRDQLARAVQELDSKLHKDTDRLQMLAEINNLLSSNWDVPLLFPRVSARIRRALRHEMASFVLYDAENHKLVRHALDFPLSKGLILQGPVSAENTPVQLALDQGRPSIFSAKELENLQNSMARSLLDEGLRSLCCVPMMRPNGPFGALILGSTRRNAFHEDDLGFLTQVANQLALAMVNHFAASEIKVLRERLGEERKYLEGEIEYEGQFTDIVGSSPALRAVLQQVTAVAASGATVLILGETGTGKELIARAIHRLSQRKEGPFIKVNCAAIPTGLLESELFGHEKGAFTGAISQKVGRMELAHRGTLFLDEVGEIPLELQPKLLRVLQDQEFERLGSNRTIKVDVRLLAATNRNLTERIARNEFRSDLYYRLSVFPVLVPPLRDRKPDIAMLVRYFVRQFAVRMNRHIEAIPHKTMDALTQWDWPGNIRELENLMERSVILTEGGVLRVPLSELRTQNQHEEHNAPDQSLDAAERQHILRVLRETQGKLSGPDGAAKRLGLKRTTLQSKMQRLNIKRKDFSGRK